MNDDLRTMAVVVSLGLAVSIAAIWSTGCDGRVAGV